MATESELRSAVDSAISNVLTKIAAGEIVTEYREGPLSVKRDSPAELLKALREMRSALSVDDGQGRRASVAMVRGAV